MTIAEHRLFIEGKWMNGVGEVSILSPFSEKPVSKCQQADALFMDRALAETARVFGITKKLSRFARSKLLFEIAQGIAARKADFIQSMVEEAGKPYLLADGEVARAVTTFTVAAEEAKRFGGEVVPIDIEASGRAYTPALAYWFARGPVLAITPFNFPLNLVAHKVAPALAAGCPVVLKPAPQTPGCSRLLAEVFEKAAAAASDAKETVPLSFLQVVHCSNEVVARAVKDERIATLSFTGSDKVGWMLQSMAQKKRVLLELGGNAAVIVHDDAQLERAAARCAFGAFAYAGQVCISVQRIYVQKKVEARFQELFLAEIAKIKCGDPAQKDVLVGPLINAAAVKRVQDWIDEAKQQGATVVAGGSKNGNCITPTLLKNVPDTTKLYCEEAFGPVVFIESYDTFEAAVGKVNNSVYGLQAGVFTESQAIVHKAVANIDAGGVLINEVPTYRADAMPYGGVKQSGLGREGLRYAMEEFSERKTVISWLG